MNYLVLDIETQELVQDWSRPWEAGLAVCCVWTSWDERFHFFGHTEIQQLKDAMNMWMIYKDPLLVTYNGKGFDCLFLSGLGVSNTDTRHHFDVCEELRLKTERRWKLEDVARRTLGAGKSGHGHQAPQLWAATKIGTLYGYCMQDVALTRDLFTFAQRHGYLTPGGVPVEIRPPGCTAGPREACEPPSKEPATERQIAFIRRLQGYDWQPVPGFTKHQAGEMIEALRRAKP